MIFFESKAEKELREAHSELQQCSRELASVLEHEANNLGIDISYLKLSEVGNGKQPACTLICGSFNEFTDKLTLDLAYRIITQEKNREKIKLITET